MILSRAARLRPTELRLCGMQALPAVLFASAWGACMAGESQPTSRPTSAPGSERPAEARRAAYDLRTVDRLTGDWGGARTKLEDAGLSINPILGTGVSADTHGGLNTGHASEFWGFHVLNVELDLEKMNLLPGATFFAQGYQSWGDGLQADTGSISDPTWFVGSYGDREIELGRWWYRQRLLDDRIELRFGKVANVLDLFDRNDFACNPFGQFMNGWLVYSPNIPLAYSLGAFARVWPTDWLYVQGLVVDPNPNFEYDRRGTAGFDTTFHGEDRFQAFWEFGLVPTLPGPNGRLTGHYRFGGWTDPRALTTYEPPLVEGLAAPQRTGDTGFFFNFDQLVWKETADARDSQGVGVFGRYAFAHEEVNRINHFWSFGVSDTGLVPGRDCDVLGLGFAQGIMSGVYRDQVDSAADHETVAELFYSIRIAPWCTVTPDLQYIAHPGGSRAGRDALVASLRVKIAF